MKRVFLINTALINTILFLKYTGAENKTTIELPASSKDVLLFERYKENYNRVYPTKETEQKGYQNFLNNLAKVNELNKEHNKNNVVVYQLNRYADLDPQIINERFGLTIIPYDDMEHGNKAAIKREHRHTFLEELNLYELNEVDDLYKIWAKKFGKPELNKKRHSIAKYYRFVKSVVEANQQKFEGNDVSLDVNADVIREPDQYFFRK